MRSTTSPSNASPRGEPIWYVQATERVWGPYALSRMQSFVAQGRLSPHSLVASQASGPFGPAGRRRELETLFPTRPPAEPQGAAPVSPTPATSLPPTPPQAAAPQATTQTLSHMAGLVRPLLVWAALHSLEPQRFEAALAAYGPFQAIRPGLWLVRAAMGPAPLRNALSRRLRGEDALLVVEAPLSGAAWFNLESAAERSLRQLWGGGEPVRAGPQD